MPGISPMYRLASDIVDGFAALDPVTATRSGIPGHDDEMTDYSPVGRERLNAFWVESLRRVAATPVTDERDRVCRDVMTDGIGLRIAQFEAGEHLRQLTIIGSPAQAVRGVFDVMPRATTADWEAIAKRLAAVPEAVGGFEAVLADGLRRGVTAARRQVEANIRQAETWSGATGAPPFFDTLLEAHDASGLANAALRTDLSRAATSANEAFAGLATYLRERYYDGATERDGVGRERYALSSRAFNGIDLDLDETYEWGWDELYRIESEMRTIASLIRPGATVPETIAFLESEPARAIDGVEPFRQWMQDL